MLEGARRRGYPAWATSVVLVLAVGGLAAVSRRYFDLHIGVPGHTGLLWMLILVAGRARAGRDGSAALMGVATALWGIPLGLGHGLGYNLAMYGLVGAVLDVVARMPWVRLEHPVGGLVAGAVAHAAKFGFILAYALNAGIAKNFLALGLLTGFGSHLLFGALGGLAAGLLLWKRTRAAP